MNLSDPDLSRWIRAACPPIEPAPPRRRAVLDAATRRRPAGRVLRLVVPFAAGVLSVFASQRLSPDTNATDPFASPPATVSPADATAAGTWGSTSAPAPAALFERIADRAPPPRAVAAPSPAPIEVAAAPVPRIS